MFFFPLQRALLEDRGAPRIPLRPPRARLELGVPIEAGMAPAVSPGQGLREVTTLAQRAAGLLKRPGHACDLQPQPQKMLVGPSAWLPKAKGTPVSPEQGGHRAHLPRAVPCHLPQTVPLSVTAGPMMVTRRPRRKGAQALL